MKGLKDLENMKNETCVPYGTQYDYFFAALEDCYIAKVPSQVYGDTAAMQTWSWTAGRISYPCTTTWPTERV